MSIQLSIDASVINAVICHATVQIAAASPSPPIVRVSQRNRGARPGAGPLGWGVLPAEHASRRPVDELCYRIPLPNSCHGMIEQDKPSMPATPMISLHQAAVGPPEPFWVFGYGSLMWRPGFYHLEQHPARLHGYHRAACIYSRHHRGTDTVPGLVLGLDTGGYCDGIAFKIDIKHRMQIIDYLHQRELIGYAYTPLTTPVTLRHAEV